MNACRSIIVAMILTELASASTDSIGLDGIDSAALPLNGSGIGIGMLELGRAGKPGFDTEAAKLNNSIEPAQVFVGDNSIFAPMPNDGFVDEHAELVAGVMISTDNTDHDNDPDLPIGVSNGAQLYSTTFNPNLMVSSQTRAAVGANHLATLGAADIRAINMSFGDSLESGVELDGNSHFTQFVDWSAAQDSHDVLYVVAGEEEFNPGDPIRPVPIDNFNGMTIAASQKFGDVYRRVADFNRFLSPPFGDRTFVSLLAPGMNIEMAALGNTIATDQEDDGTSFAAPHVTGTVALLQ